ncbi:MAG: phosphopantetheine-binding protein [Flavobacteriales bacterium]
MLEVGIHERPRPRSLANKAPTARSKQPCLRWAILAGNGNELAQLLKAVGGLWQSGVLIDWNNFYEREERHRISLPTYAFERIRHWVDPVASIADGGRAVASTTHRSAGATRRRRRPYAEGVVDRADQTPSEESSGLDLAEASDEETFLEMGLDSLFLTQVATSLSKKFGVKISFRATERGSSEPGQARRLLVGERRRLSCLPQLSVVSGSRTTDNQQPTTVSALEDAPN